MRKFKFYAFALLIGGLLFSVGCSKDSDDDDDNGGDNPSGTNYRVHESIEYEGNVETSKDVFAYEGEKLSTVTSYEPQGKTEWEMDSKSEISYPDANSFEILSSDYDGGEWELDYKEVVTVQDGLWLTDMEYYYNGSDWISDYKTEYSYNSGKIVKEEEFWFDGGEMFNETKILYSWVGDTPSAAENYEWQEDVWVAVSKDTLIFSNGKISELKQFDYETSQYFLKMEFQYIGDDVSSIVFSVNFGGIWTNAGTFSFTYDEHGNLTEQEITSSFLDSSRITHVYEEGIGNVSSFSPNTGWYDISLPFKSGAKSPSSFQDIKELYSSFLKK